MNNTQELAVKVETPDDPIIFRAFAILKDRIQQRSSTRVVADGTDPQIILSVDGNLPYEAFRIGRTGAAVHVSGGSPRGLLYGVGKFLRTSCYDGKFLPSPWRGTSAPQGTLRGMYFASHFHNWYHQAPEPEVTRYMEDLALWGLNAVMVHFPFINLQGWEDPEAESSIDMIRMYARIARNLGLLFGIAVTNIMFRNVPDHIRAVPLPDSTRRRGNCGTPVCPGNPEGYTYIIENTRHLFKRLTDTGLDFLTHWPYDEGGCACEKCLPWGSNGFLKLSRGLTRLGREYFPDLKTILSTWLFDTPPECEWQGLTDDLRKDAGWVNYILADSHEDFPRYPLDAGVPGNLPLLNFPEISMWGNWPWGGFGANPLPSRFQRLWDQVKYAVAGGFPYSEGIYEDMNKIVILQFYWDRNRHARTTLEEYIAYEFGPEVTKDVLAVIDILETVAGRSYLKQSVDAQEVKRACRLADAVDSRLPGRAKKNWRWEILRLRTVLDHERFIGGGLATPAAETAMTRLIEIYHCEMETDDPYHHRVRPPLRRAVSRCGEK